MEERWVEEDEGEEGEEDMVVTWKKGYGSSYDDHERRP